VWEYVFFIDIEGHIEDAAVQNAMQALDAYASMIKHLGSYPRAVL
jgi:chorismate mutase/prephenate dehydratase